MLTLLRADRAARRLGNESLGLFVPSLPHQRAHARSADGRAAQRKAGDGDKFDAVARQDARHDAVIDARDGIKRLLARKAPRDMQHGGDGRGEERNVQLTLQRGGALAILEKIGGEGGGGDHIGSAQMHAHVGKLRRAFLYKAETCGGREERAIFLHHEKMQHIAVRGGVFHQRTVAQGEGIGVHHDRSDGLILVAACEKRLSEAARTVRAVLKQHERIRAHHGIEPAGSKKRLVVRARDDAQVIIAFGEAGAYAAVCIVGLFFIYGYNAISAVLRGMGDSKRPFFFISIAAVTNIALDLLFVLALDMGSMGAALAMVMSQGLSFVLCSLFIYRHRAQYELTVEEGRFFGIDGEMLASLIRLGFPMALKSASVNFSKLFVNSWLNSYGVAVSAFAGIASKINSISNLVSNAFSTAGSSMIGQNISAGKYERVKKVMGSVFFMAMISALLFSAAFLLFPQQIYSVFISGEDAEVMAIGMRFLPIAILIFFGSTARSGMNALINGSGNHVVNFIAAILDGIVLRIGLSVLFGLGFGMREMGFWLGDALAGFTPFWIGLALYMSGKWKKKAVR